MKKRRRRGRPAKHSETPESFLRRLQQAPEGTTVSALSKETGVSFKQIGRWGKKDPVWRAEYDAELERRGSLGRGRPLSSERTLEAIRLYGKLGRWSAVQEKMGKDCPQYPALLRRIDPSDSLFDPDAKAAWRRHVQGGLCQRVQDAINTRIDEGDVPFSALIDLASRLGGGHVIPEKAPARVKGEVQVRHTHALDAARSLFGELPAAGEVLEGEVVEQ